MLLNQLWLRLATHCVANNTYTHVPTLLPLIAQFVHEPISVTPKPMQTLIGKDCVNTNICVTKRALKRAINAFV